MNDTYTRWSARSDELFDEIERRLLNAKRMKGSTDFPRHLRAAAAALQDAQTHDRQCPSPSIFMRLVKRVGGWTYGRMAAVLPYVAARHEAGLAG